MEPGMEPTMGKYFITTTLPYINSVPHIGHALEFFQADAYARYFRRKYGKENVFFNVGVDEHGLKVLTAAEKAGIPIEDYVNDLSGKWVKFCQDFSVEYDSFYRTSSESHHRAVHQVWKECLKKGDIYKRHYIGKYCVGCEAYISERDLVSGKCPFHDLEPETYSEENYFFRLGKYAAQVIDYVEQNADFLKPPNKRSELLNFLRGMEDISISRKKESLPWGVTVPGDPKHTVYVWFDALINYIAVIGFNTDLDCLKDWWPGIQLCGPDNLRFQGAIWQGMLASLGLPFTRTLLVHGTVMGSDGQKMSKTLGNVVSPSEQIMKYGSDICRFYLLGVLRTYSDCVYNETELRDVCNSYLSNNYGNLLARVVHLANSKSINLDHLECDSIFREEINKKVVAVEKAYESFDLFAAVSEINNLVSFGNKYFQEEQPWALDPKRAKLVLDNLAMLILKASTLYEPIIPKAAQMAINSVRDHRKIILFPKLK